MTIRLLIVDDEEPARVKLKKLLSDQSDFEIVGESGDGSDAVRKIMEIRPDAVFLDVQMPEMDGFGVLRCLPEEVMPRVVFVTAHDRFAVQAFEVHAIDYLLKPFDRDRFQVCLDRLRSRLCNDRNAGKDPSLLHLVQNLLAKQQPDRIPVKQGDRIVLVNPSELDWIEAADNYVLLHQGKQEFIFRSTMNSMEKRLQQGSFIRVSRSAMVNSEKICELQSLFRGEFVILMKNGDRVHTSRNYKDVVKRFTGA